MCVCVCEVSTVHISLSLTHSPPLSSLFPSTPPLPRVTYTNLSHSQESFHCLATLSHYNSVFVLSPSHTHTRHYPTALEGTMCVHGAQTLLSALLGLTVVARQQCFQWFAVFLLVDMSKSLEKSWLFLGSVSLFGFTAKCLRALHVKFAHVMSYIYFSFYTLRRMRSTAYLPELSPSLYEFSLFFFGLSCCCFGVPLVLSRFSAMLFTVILH